jgi:ferritin
MYHQAPDMDSDFVRAWTLIHELSDQLAHNQKMISTLASQAGLLQVRAVRKPKATFRAVSETILLSVG